MSSTPITVTVWAVLQLELVKVRLEGLTVPSPVSELLTPTVTFADGWLLSKTVNVALSPNSVVLSLMLLIVNPAVSSSVLVTATSAGFMELKLLSLEVAAPSTIL